MLEFASASPTDQEFLFYSPVAWASKCFMTLEKPMKASELLGTTGILGLSFSHPAVRSSGL